LARQLFSERSKHIVGLFQKYKNSQLPYNEFMMGPVDSANTIAVKDILQSPADVDINSTSFTALVPLFGEWVRKWKPHLPTPYTPHLSAGAKEKRKEFILGYDNDYRGRSQRLRYPEGEKFVGRVPSPFKPNRLRLRRLHAPTMEFHRHRPSLL
jgi:hypothetical protein